MSAIHRKVERTIYPLGPREAASAGGAYPRSLRCVGRILRPRSPNRRGIYSTNHWKCAADGRSSHRSTEFETTTHAIDEFRRKVEVGLAQSGERRLEIEQALLMGLGQDTQGTGNVQMPAIGFGAPFPLVD